MYTTKQCSSAIELQASPNNAYISSRIRPGIPPTPRYHIRCISHPGLYNPVVPTPQSQRSVRQRRLGMRFQYIMRPRLLRCSGCASLPWVWIRVPPPLASRSGYHGNRRLGQRLLPDFRWLFLENVGMLHARAHDKDERASGGRLRAHGSDDHVDATSTNLRSLSVQIPASVGHLAAQRLLRSSTLNALTTGE